MTNPKLTIKEIAEMAGVSPTAVSFVINGREGHVGKATRKKIKAVIKESGYHPNVASRRMRMNKTFNIALFYPSVASPFIDLFYTDIVNSLISQFSTHDYHLIHCPVETTETGYITPKIIEHRDIDGAILLQSISPDIFQDLDTLAIPYILVDWQDDAHEHICVSVDCELAISSAIHYLAKMGHRDIAFLGLDHVPYYFKRCLDGYQNTLKSLGLTYHPKFVHNTINDVESASKCIKQLIECNPAPTAVCCTSDMCAIYAMQAATSLGLTLPESLSFISIDNILLSQFVTPPLTTVDYSKEEIGLKTANMLLDMIGGTEVTSIAVSAKGIVERQSVKNLQI